MATGRCVVATNGQLALIHVAKSELKLADDTYRDILWEQGGRVRSSRDLKPEGVEAVLRRFRELGWQGLPPAKRPRLREDRPLELPTSGQLGVIRHLWEDLGWHETDRRQGFTARVCSGHPWPQSREEANKLIEALKAMVKRGSSGRTRPTGTTGSPPAKPPASSAPAGRGCDNSR